VTTTEASLFKRDWTSYFVRATLARKPPDLLWPEISEEEKLRHRENLLSGWEMQVFVFPKRILCAHGRDPYLLGRKPENAIERYLEAGMTLVNNYLKRLASGDWSKLSG